MSEIEPRLGGNIDPTLLTVEQKTDKRPEPTKTIINTDINLTMPPSSDILGSPESGKYLRPEQKAITVEWMRRLEQLREELDKTKVRLNEISGADSIVELRGEETELRKKAEKLKCGIFEDAMMVDALKNNTGVEGRA